MANATARVVRFHKLGGQKYSKLTKSHCQNRARAKFASKCRPLG
jgi:hypothetical protein